jgi:hypothetical protein
MLRKVGVLVGLLVFAGTLSAADPQEKRESKKPKQATESKAVMAKVVSVDAAKGMLTVKTKEGKEEELTVGEHTRFVDAQGKDLAKGIKDKRLAKGADVQLMLDEDGKMVKEIHLAAGTRTARTSGRPSKVFPTRPGEETPSAHPDQPAARPKRPLPEGGTVVKTDAKKKQIVIKMADSKGKTEERTIDVKEGVKLLGAEGEEADIGGFAPGEVVMIQEKDGKVTQVQIFKLGAGEKRKIIKK